MAFATSDAGAADFELKDGDRVVWLGSTLIEREQRYGYWEMALTARYPDRNITFRNLGWSGDTVWGEARAGFDTAAKGYERLVALTRELKPTVVVVCYGTNESFAAEPGVSAFRKQYARLLDDLAPTKARFVLLSPLPFETSSHLGDPDARNRHLALYRDATRDLAAERGAHFADLFEKARATRGRVTDNGMHPSEEGYRLLTPLLEIALGWEKTTNAAGPAAAALRTAIVDKNELFFHRWRPQNETYLFGFRKHEQGKNANEVAEFDPLVAAKENEIARLRTAATDRQK